MSVLQHFLVPLDGSIMAEATLPVAVGLGQPLGATISLLHVLEQDAPRTIHGEPHLHDVAGAEKYLADIASRWSVSGATIDWHVHQNTARDVANSIVEHAEELKADLIVIATHGRGGLRKLLFGSIAQQVLRRGPIPTLIVRPPEAPAPLIYRCHSILVPLDGTHESETALRFAGNIARATGASVLLASVIPTLGTATGDLVVSATFSPTATSAVLDLAQVDAGTYLERQAADLRGQGVDVKVAVSRGGTATKLAEVAADSQVDLVILSTHGRSGLDGTLSGSVAPQLLGELRVPTMLIRIGSGA